MEYKLITERSHLYAPNINICFLIDFYETQNVDALQTAILKTMQKYPILRSIILFKENAPFFHIQDNVNLDFSIKTNCGKNDWGKVIFEEQARPFRLDQELLIRFVCLKNKNDMQLIMCLHHTLADGVSCIKLAENILHFLQSPKEEVVSQPVTLLEDISLYSNERLDFPLNLIFGFLNWQWRRTAHIFTKIEYETMRKNYWEECSHNIDFFEIGTEKTKEIVDACKANNVSVNSLLMTTLLRSTQKAYNSIDNNKKIGIAVSVHSNETNIGNYASGVSVEYVYDNKKSLWENTLVMHNLVRDKLSSDKKKYFLLTLIKTLNGDLLDSIYFNLFENFKNKASEFLGKALNYSRTPHGLALTNLGKVDLSFNNQVRSIYFVPPLVASTDKIAGVVTINDKIVVVCQYLKNEDSNINQAIFTDWIQNLRNNYGVDVINKK